MKGIINKGIQEFVEQAHGKDMWAEVMRRAGCEAPFFAVGQDYPDEMSVALIGAAAEMLGLPPETIMVECGKFMVPNTLKRLYPTYFVLAGSSSREFLLNMGRVHEQVTRSVAHATPPRLEYDELDDGRLLMHYYSERKLCPVLRGLILGVGVLFGQELHLQETSCMHKGDPGCTMAISFP